MTTLKDLYEAIDIIEKVVQDLRNAPEQRLIADLLDSLESIDNQINYYMEPDQLLESHMFYVEGRDWVTVRACLQRLREGSSQ
jgi:predicted AlkP superfamily phosphohydrolase/phosphomutase